MSDGDVGNAVLATIIPYRDADTEACSCPGRIRDVLERNLAIREAVLSLDSPVRETMLLYYWGDVTAGDVALEMRVSVRTVEDRLARGRRMVREALTA